jgi:CIC family chloride channel protein
MTTWKRLKTFGRRVFLNEDIFPLVLGSVIGLGGGLGAIAFRKLVTATGEGFRLLREAPVWDSWVAIPVTVALGGLLVGTITRFFAREVKGHGVPEVMSAVAKNRGIIRMRVVLAKAIASALSIGSGGSVGREGPIVQIGSALGSGLGQLLNAPLVHMRTLVGCGAAAGISATFNAPFAGVLFALEVILRDFRFRSLTPIVCSSVIATAVSRSYFGDIPAFPAPALTLGHPVELGLYVVLGGLAGVAAVFFLRFLYLAEDAADRLRIPDPLKAALGGLLVGGLALECREVMGVGYETIENTLNGTGGLTIAAFVLLFGAKILATSVTLASGGSGGVFAPSLFMGAMLGGAVGYAFQAVLPGFVTQPEAYALVGMGAFVAAATHAPLSAILILFELTDDYKIILPLMLASIVSTVVSRRLCAESIYTLKLSRRGESISVDPATNLLASAQVKDVVHSGSLETLQENSSFARIVDALKKSSSSDLAVVDRDGLLLGVVRFRSLKIVLDSQEVHPLLVAKDVCEENPDCLLPDEPLDEAFRAFQDTAEQYIPVVSSTKEARFLGFLSHADIIHYYKKLVEAENSGHNRGPG